MNVTYQNGWAVPEGWKLVPEKPTYELECEVGGVRMDEEFFLHEYADHEKIGEICRAVVKYSPPPPKAPDYNPGPLEVSVIGMPEFDALLDHIYEEGTGSEGVVHLANKLVRAAIQSHISYARNAQPVAYKWGGVLILAEESHPVHRKEGQPLYVTPIAACDPDTIRAPLEERDALAATLAATEAARDGYRDDAHQLHAALVRMVAQYESEFDDEDTHKFRPEWLREALKALEFVQSIEQLGDDK